MPPPPPRHLQGGGDVGGLHVDIFYYITCQLNPPWGPILVIPPLLRTNTLSYMYMGLWGRGERPQPPPLPMWSLKGVLW